MIATFGDAGTVPPTDICGMEKTSMTGGFDLPHGDRDDKDPYDPKPWLRPHKDR